MITNTLRFGALQFLYKYYVVCYRRNIFITVFYIEKVYVLKDFSTHILKNGSKFDLCFIIINFICRDISAKSTWEYSESYFMSLTHLRFWVQKCILKSVYRMYAKSLMRWKYVLSEMFEYHSRSRKLITNLYL